MESSTQSSAAGSSKDAVLIRDLIVINNDRRNGYQTAAEETKDADLKSLFMEYSKQSEGWASELRRFLPAGSDQPGHDETKNTGKLYRVFMDLKAAITGKDRKAVLSNCEFGEDVAKKHYDEVLKNISGLSTEAQECIRRQHSEQLKAHDRVKAMRDSA